MLRFSQEHAARGVREVSFGLAVMSKEEQWTLSES